MTAWINNSFFYHIYPLGALGAPQHNDFSTEPINRLGNIHSWLDHIQELGANALYLGPLFESSTHGYDTADYFSVDRRLGTNAQLSDLSKHMHDRGMRLILDAVFNHVGRDFWAFKDLLEKREASAYKDWFTYINFQEKSPYGDPFGYEGWNGHHSLVKLNLENPSVQDHIFKAVEFWTDTFDIDGLRLDAADAISHHFLRSLRDFCKPLKQEFWLMGEVIHGDYRQWVNAETLDSVTNYQLYKGLYSSHNDNNYFELAYSLREQFSEGGIYENMQLYNFLDNHDVNRIRTQLSKQESLSLVYLLLFTVPGIPSIYYGSEFGLEGKRTNWDDNALRPYFDLNALQTGNTIPDLKHFISELNSIRQNATALQTGAYQQLHVAPQQLVFSRTYQNEYYIIAVNNAAEQQTLSLSLPEYPEAVFTDLLNSNEQFKGAGNVLNINLHPFWGRILKKIA